MVRIAQSAEQSVVARLVAGSNPAPRPSLRGVVERLRRAAWDRENGSSILPTPTKLEAPIVQLARMPDCRSGGRGFESHWARHRSLL